MLRAWGVFGEDVGSKEAAVKPPWMGSRRSSTDTPHALFKYQTGNCSNVPACGVFFNGFAIFRANPAKNKDSTGTTTGGVCNNWETSDYTFRTSIFGRT